MKRHLEMIASAFFILAIVMSVIPPLRANAQAGPVTISGHVSYQPRNYNSSLNNMMNGIDIEINLYEQDQYGVSYYLDTTYSDINGNYSFPSRLNWWTQDGAPLNVYLVLVTYHLETNVTNLTIPIGNYTFRNFATSLPPNPTATIDFPLTSAYQDYEAMWIFEDLRNTWNFVYNNDIRNGSHHGPGSVTAMWEKGANCYPFPDKCGSYTNAPLHYIFIARDNNNQSMDVVVQETSHMFMANANGVWYTGCLTHSILTSSSVDCAWPEGWADFLPLPVNNDVCYNLLSVNPCQGAPDSDYYNLEVHSRADLPAVPWGDTVEGRVAGALYDLYDSNNEGFDSMSTGFSPIAKIALGISPIYTFHDFWNNWAGGNGTAYNFYSGLTLWWNTINYANIRQIFLPVIKN
jgi:hypothetical protein